MIESRLAYVTQHDDIELTSNDLERTTRNQIFKSASLFIELSKQIG